MSERYTRADVANILVNVNKSAARLGMRNAGQLTVETMGGSYLYLTDRSSLDDRHTGPGRRVLDLGKGWHAAAVALQGYLQALNTVEQSSPLVDVIRKLPTIRESQADNLVAEGGGVRLWVSRMTPEDGPEILAHHAVTAERFDGNAWVQA